MINLARITIGLSALIALACATASCGSSDSEGGVVGAGGSGGSAGSGGAQQPTTFAPQDGVATNITLAVHSNGWGTLLETKTVATEGPVLLDTNDPKPYSDPAPFYVYASADGFYTKVYTGTKGETINVDLDAVGAHPQSLAGVIFSDQSFFAPSVLSALKPITLTGTGVNLQFNVDSQGRYGVGPLPEGSYKLQFVDGQSREFDLTSNAGISYKDLHYTASMQAGKPNIYLYPTKDTQVTVTLGFPQGGYVTVSDPPYGQGWNVLATPQGTLNGQYQFLFYEAEIPQRLDLSHGWALEGKELESGLRGILSGLGFVGQEIDDFITYWIPVLEGADWYAIYPQAIDDLVTLSVTPTPDVVIRALFLVRPLSSPVVLAPPSLKPVSRKGFVVTEWGVLKGI